MSKNRTADLWQYCSFLSIQDDRNYSEVVIRLENSTCKVKYFLRLGCFLKKKSKRPSNDVFV